MIERQAARIAELEAALNADDAAKLDADLKLNGRVAGWVSQARELIAA